MTDSATSPTRDSGIDAVGHVPWGTHPCLFYETREDLVDLMVPYLAHGLLSDEFCVWMPSAPDVEETVRRGLSAHVPDLTSREAAGQIAFVTGDDWFGGRPFTAADVLEAWDEKYAHALAAGFAGVRGGGDASWVAKGDRERLVRVEAGLHRWVRDKRVLLLCTYPLDATVSADVFDFALSHHFVLSRRRGRWETVETPEHKKAVAEIERLNRELERRVEERTTELRDMQRYLAEGQRLTHCGSFAWDALSGEYTFWSEEQFRIYGFEPAAHPPLYAETLERLHPDDRAKCVELRRRVLTEGRDLDGRLRIVLPDGRTRYVLRVDHPVIRDGRVVGIVGSDLDVTEQRRSAARLSRLRRRAREQALEARFAAILEERSRLAREIHDSLLQGVTGIALQLRAVLPRLRVPETADGVRRIAELAESTAHDARQTVWEMRTGPLQREDLVGALEDTVRAAATDIDVHVGVEGEPWPVESAEEDTILRVARESAVNAAKHSGSDRLDVRLRYGAADLTLTVSDAGRGFDVEAASRASGRRWGLLGMRERADRIGATLEIRTHPGDGTEVTLRIPRRGSPAREASSA